MRSPVGSAGAVDDLARAAPQCGDPRQPSGTTGFGGAVEAEQAAKRPKAAKLATERSAREYVEDRRPASHPPDGTVVAGPDVPARMGRHATGSDRRWAMAWSPEQIGGRLLVDFPDDESCGSRHETIYQALYVQGRGGCAAS